MRAGRLPGLRRVPGLLGQVEPNVVLFNSWHGLLADNPLAISKALTARRPDLEQVWVLDDPAVAPPGASTVRLHSAEYLRALGRARWVFSNDSMPAYYRKRPGTTYVQTWHGTPLKKIGFDVERPAFRDASRYFRNLSKDVSKWDFLISQSSFSHEAFRQAFRYDGPVLDTGYPRNDCLFASDGDAVRARVREELGIPEDARAILYAPTWRDDQPFSFELPIDELSAKLGPEYVWLFRAHRLDVPQIDWRQTESAVNVSAWHDIGSLYFAADVLVTDYSSVMFDFAITGKPMLFFTPDLALFRDDLRGFYFDFPADAPGPLLETVDGVVEALGDLARVNERCGDAYARFRERFCHLDDGRASERVLDAVIGGA